MITTYYGVVQPWLCDFMGHLTTRFYVGMFDDAHSHLFAGVGIDPEAMLKDNLGFADVKSTLEYQSELAVGALLEIKSSFISLGNKSFVHRHEMYNRTSGKLAATMENVTVLFDLEARVAVPLTDDFRRKAEASMEND